MEQLPPSIRTFERMQIVALATGWLNATWAYHSVLSHRLSAFVFTTALVTVSVVVIVLIFLISRRRSTWAKWLLIVLSAARPLRGRPW